MITADGWIDWAIRKPGPANKVNAGTNQVYGIFLHSAEGYEQGLWSQLANAPVSWHLTNLFDGRLYQHYPLTARCWHATAANQSYVGMEHEGRVLVEPTLTDAQIRTAVKVIQEIKAKYIWLARRPNSAIDTSHTLWEHKEVVRLGGSSSACPSGRIPWQTILAQLQQPPPQQEEGNMIDHSRVVEWWNGRHLEDGNIGGIYRDVNNFDLPPEAKRVRIGVYLTNGVGDGSGYMRFFNANGSEASPIGWGQKPIYAESDVSLSDEGVTFKVEGGYVDVAVLRCLGYWT